MSQTKSCRVCGKDKPRDSFPKTGRNAQRCYSCAEAADVTTAPVKSAAKSQSAIPVESVPRLPELPNSATPVELAPILAALAELTGLREFKRRVLELANA